MVALRMLEIAVGVIAGFFVFQQVFLPLMRGTELFPMFSTEGDLQDELSKARQAKHEKHISDTIESIREELRTKEKKPT